MTCNYKHTYVTHYLSTTVHCASVVHLREINPIQQISENLSHIMCEVHYQFLQVGPQLPPCSSSLQTDNKTLLRTGFLCNFIQDNMEPDFVDPFYHPDLSEQNIFHGTSHVHNPILFSIHNNMHLLSTDSHSD